MKHISLILGALLLSAALSPAAPVQTNPTETPAQKDARMAWWRDAKFGMFIHWGIYAVPARGEWFMTQGHVPKAEYEKYAAQFAPTNFDAATWVRTAKDAGMKYLVITSKHHDGFCMFDTMATSYNVIKDTPWHHDPLKDLAQQCRRQGVRFCVYYSVMDWHHPDQEAAKDDPQHPEYNPTQMRPGQKDDYTQYMKTQLHELITQYHPGLIWFDGSWPSWWTHEDGKALYTWLRQQDPKLVINDRVKGAGDYGTPEQRIPAAGLKEDWETCMTINNNWGFNADDHDFKSTESLLFKLVDIDSKGGNFLLNVGPTAQGVIPQPEVDRLAEIGRWMKVNGEAIYGAGPTPFGAELGAAVKAKDGYGNATTVSAANDWRCTTKPGKIYLCIFHWPADGKFLVPGLESKVKRAYLLAGKKAVRFQQTDQGVMLSLPSAAPDKIASVICLKIADPQARVARQK
jgi:alpha-L-fucosidase